MPRQHCRTGDGIHPPAGLHPISNHSKRQKRSQARQMAQRLASATVRRLVLYRDESVRSCRSKRGQCSTNLSLSDTSIQRRRVEYRCCITSPCGYLLRALHHVLWRMRRALCFLRKITTLTTVRSRNDGPTRANTKRCANWTTDRAEQKRDMDGDRRLFAVRCLAVPRPPRVYVNESETRGFCAYGHKERSPALDPGP